MTANPIEQAPRIGMFATVRNPRGAVAAVSQARSFSYLKEEQWHIPNTYQG